MIRPFSVSHVLYELWITNANQLTGHLGRITLNSLNAHITGGQVVDERNPVLHLCECHVFLLLCLLQSVLELDIFLLFWKLNTCSYRCCFCKFGCDSGAGLCGAQWSWAVLKPTGRTREILCLGRALAAHCLRPLYLGTADWLWFLFLHCLVIHPSASLCTISVSHSFGQDSDSIGDFCLTFDILFDLFGVIRVILFGLNCCCGYFYLKNVFMPCVWVCVYVFVGL